MKELKSETVLRKLRCRRGGIRQGGPREPLFEPVRDNDWDLDGTLPGDAPMQSLPVQPDPQVLTPQSFPHNARSDFVVDLVESALCQYLLGARRTRRNLIITLMVALCCAQLLVLNLNVTRHIAFEIAFTFFAAWALFSIFVGASLKQGANEEGTTMLPLLRALHTLLHDLPERGRFRNQFVVSDDPDETPEVATLLKSMANFLSWSMTTDEGRQFWKDYLTTEDGREWERKFGAFCETLKSNQTLSDWVSDNRCKSPALQLVHFALAGVPDTRLLQPVSPGHSSSTRLMQTLLDLSVLLGFSNGKMTHEGVLRFLASTDENLRELALDYLRENDNQATLDIILAALVENPSIEVRREIAGMLKDRQAPHLTEVIAIAMVDDDKLIRLRALEALEGRPEADELIFMLEAALLDDIDIQIQALEVIGNCRSGRAHRLLQQASQASSEQVRDRAFGMLRDCRPPGRDADFQQQEVDSPDVKIG